VVQSQQPSDNNPILAIFRYERLRRMIAWLLEHQDQIADLEKVQIVFDCAGKKVNASKKESFHDI